MQMIAGAISVGAVLATHGPGLAAGGGVRAATPAEQGAAKSQAQAMAGGHAFEKHVVQRGEFPLVSTRAKFAEGVGRVINSPQTLVRSLSNGRTAFFHQPSGTLVITHPGFEGTMFRPDLGIDYFLKVLK
jgi:filamentous hemagglutinin